MSGLMRTTMMTALCRLLIAVCCLCGISALADPLPLLGIGRVSTHVTDLDSARAFYSGVCGFDEAFDVRRADGSVKVAYFKVNDHQFLEVIPGLKSDQVRPMDGFAILTDQIRKLRSMLEARGLHPGKIHSDSDGSRGFNLTDLPGQNLAFLEFVQYGPKSLAGRTKGKYLGPHRLSTRLEHVGVIATNFDAAYDFYAKTLGFNETWRRLTVDRGRVILDHIQMPGTSEDVVELSNQTDAKTPLTRNRAGEAAHFALTVSDVKALMLRVNDMKPGLRETTPHYGLDNRWNFNLFDPDGTRVEFMQSADPAHPAPAVVVTPADWR